MKLTPSVYTPSVYTPSVYTDSNVPIIFEKNLVNLYSYYWVIVVVVFLVLAVIYRIFYSIFYSIIYLRYIKIIPTTTEQPGRSLVHVVIRELENVNRELENVNRENVSLSLSLELENVNLQNQEIYRIKKVTTQNTQNTKNTQNILLFKSGISKSEEVEEVQEIRKYIFIDDSDDDECDKKDHTLEKKKIYIDVPYTEKNVAKRLGALWDKKYNKWYIPENVESRLILAIWNES